VRRRRSRWAGVVAGMMLAAAGTASHQGFLKRVRA
jgi:hypothetical protein